MPTLTKKDKLIFDAEVHYLFTPKAFTKYPGKDFFKDVRRLAHLFQFNGKTLFLSEKCLAAYNKLTDILENHKGLTAHISRQEIHNLVTDSHKHWLNAELEPDGKEFLSHILLQIAEMTKTYKFLVILEGIRLEDLDVLRLGPVSIHRSEKIILEEIALADVENVNEIYDQVKSKYWLIGETYGGPTVASDHFEFKVKFAIGILTIYGVILYKWVFWKTRIFAKLDALEHRSAVTILRWDKGGGNLTTSRRFGDIDDLMLTGANVKYLKSNLFFDQLVELMTIQTPTELQDAIITAIFWFYDAYNDSSPTMKLIKLWSCSECFFSTTKYKLVEKNSKGLAVILTFAGYNICHKKDYIKTKKTATRLYELRSNAVHSAELDGVTTKDINIMSNWIAWLIISMIALTEQGYKTLQQIKEQVDRLDAKETEASNIVLIKQ